MKTIVVGYDDSDAAQAALGWATDELMRVAGEEDAALIVIGMSPRGTLNELVFGSSRHELLHHAVRPVVAVPAAWKHAPAVSA